MGRDLEPDYGGGSGGFSFRITMHCHKCGREGEQSEVNRSWLQPVNVRQNDDSWLQTQLCPSCAKWKLLYWIKVVWKLRIGKISNFLAPGFSSCGHCHTNWHFVEGHSTYIPSTGSGMFPLCEQCWSDLTPQRRLPYYRAVYDRWSEHSFTWQQLEAAVLSEGSTVN